jgi:hypothetical protein
MNYIDLPK